MTPKIKNIIIFVGIGVALILVYVFFIKSSPDQASLTSTSGNSAGTVSPNGSTPDANSLITQNFLSLLLNVKSISLNDAIFSDPAFISLKDSSIELVQDGTEGRPNPFAPIGSDVVAAPVVSTGAGAGAGTNTTVNGGTPPLLGSTPLPTGVKTGTTGTGITGTKTFPITTPPAKAN